MSASTTPRASRTSSTRFRAAARSGRRCSKRSGSDFKPRTAEVMEFKPSEVTAQLDQFLAPYLFPDKADGGDARLCPNCGKGQLALRGGKFGAFIACSNYPECKYTRRFAQGGGRGRGHRARRAGQGSRDRAGSRAQIGAVRAVYPARRGQGRQARLDPQGHARARPRMGAQAAELAARGRRASRERQPDHRVDRPLRPLSGA